MNWHRHDYTERDADTKPVQTGTPVFIRELKSRHFPKADEIVKHVKGQHLTLQYLQTNGFETPIIIDGKDGLDITIPPLSFSVYDVETYIGKIAGITIFGLNIMVISFITTRYYHNIYN